MYVKRELINEWLSVDLTGKGYVNSSDEVHLIVLYMYEHHLFYDVLTMYEDADLLPIIDELAENSIFQWDESKFKYFVEMLLGWAIEYRRDVVFIHVFNTYGEKCYNSKYMFEMLIPNMIHNVKVELLIWMIEKGNINIARYGEDSLFNNILYLIDDKTIPIFDYLLSCFNVNILHNMLLTHNKQSSVYINNYLILKIVELKNNQVRR